MKSPSQGVDRPNATRIHQESREKGHTGGSQTSQQPRSPIGLEKEDRPASNSPGGSQGSNPGSVQLAGQRHPLFLPRVHHKTGRKISLAYLDWYRKSRQLDGRLQKRLLYGISCGNYKVAAAAVPGAIGLSSFTVLRTFTQASAKQLQALRDRDMRPLNIVTMFLDGMQFAEMTMVGAVGNRIAGDKHMLGFEEPGQENE